MKTSPRKSQNKTDVDSTESHHRGFKGLLESTLRKFRTGFHLAVLVPFYGLACVVFGLSASPGLWFLHEAFLFSQSWPAPLKILFLSTCSGVAYFSYGFFLILIAPLTNWVLRARLEAWRGPYYSADSIRWYIHNGITYLVRYTFLEFITPTPLNLFYFQKMGMKIGTGTVINTSHISDPSLIELGKKVTIGGSVTLVGHYGQAGFLVLAPVVIEDGATIGLRATIMGGVRIGANAKILPNSVVLPKTIVPAGETWGGVPAQPIADIAFALRKVP